MAGSESDSSEYALRLSHIAGLERHGIDPYPADPYRASHQASQLLSDFDTLNGNNVSIAGRMVSRRDHGKLIFTHVEDASGKIQAAIAQNRAGDAFPLVKQYYDIGDFVGIQGTLGTTKTGEISVWAQDVAMLAKSLRAAPLKISDAEIMQRQRYLHTLVDPEARARFRTRSQIVQHMRDYFIGRLGSLEVETPILDTTYGGAQAKPFETYHNALGTKMFMRISNELYLKRMTLSYLEGVFEFSRDFRNEGMDRTHNPEFTQVEFYKPFWDYQDMMDMVEDMMSGIAQKIHGTTEVPYKMAVGNGEDKEVVINYAKPWKRLSIYDGLRDKLGIEPAAISDSKLRSIAHEYGVDEYTRGDTMLKLFEELWESSLIQPTFVRDYPDDTSALTKRHRVHPELTERFEMYAGGIETMNCYTELNDPRDQRKRFELEQEKREKGHDTEAMMFDEDYILAQEYGMPQQAGIGISIDRWTMLLTNVNHIRQAIYFPALRPILPSGGAR
jgi:lysyl-tRNA synthetase, class II